MPGKEIKGRSKRANYRYGGEVDLLAEHAKHHSAKHMVQMKADMKKGDSFKTAHNKAMKKVGV